MNYTEEELLVLREKARVMTLELDPTASELELQEATVF